MNLGYLCDYWTPLLFNLVLAMPKGILNIKDLNLEYEKEITLNYQFYDINPFNCELSKLFFENQYNTIIEIILILLNVIMD